MTGEVFSELRDNLKPVRLLLKDVFLDPNNPRFVRDDSELVPDSRIIEVSIQESALAKMENEVLDDLIENIKEVGFLSIDRMVVRQVGSSENYVIVEGNRRLSSLKKIKAAHESGEISLAEDVLETIVQFDALEYTGKSSMIAWVVQGLRHISGIRDWEAFQKGKFIYELVHTEGKSLGDVGRMIGVSAQQAGTWFRAYSEYHHLVQEPEIGSRIKPSLFPYLQELFGRGCTSLREWLQWDEDKGRFLEDRYMREIVSWRFPDEGNEQLITQAIELRKISKLRSEVPSIFDRFREGLSLDEAYTQKLEEDARKRAAGSLDSHLEMVRELAQRLGSIPFLEATRRKDDVISLYKEIIKTAKDVVKSLK